MRSTVRIKCIAGSCSAAWLTTHSPVSRAVCSYPRRLRPKLMRKRLGHDTPSCKRIRLGTIRSCRRWCSVRLENLSSCAACLVHSLHQMNCSSKSRRALFARTDLHVVDGELPDPKHPIIPGHEIVGRVEALGSDVENFELGDRVGIPWLGWTCGKCRYCRDGHENLCPAARFTGYQIDGGYAEFTTADARYCFRIPAAYSDVEAAPLLCAGLIGYRTLKMAGDAEKVGIYGFGAAAHIVAQVLRNQERALFAFTTPGDTAAQDFALEMGAVWAGGSRSAIAGTAGCGDDLCSSWRTGACRPEDYPSGRDRGMRRHTHERYPYFSLRYSLA